MSETIKPRPKMPKMWADKYAPESLDDYVFTDDDRRALIESWIASGDVPHCLLAGAPGTGKTSLAILLMKLMDVPSENWWLVNASVEGGIDNVRDDIIRFVRGQSLSGGMKYIILDEADGLTAKAQEGLRGVINEAAGSTRFILTCNNIKKLSNALKSRVKVLMFQSMDKATFMTRVAKVLIAEKVGIDEAGLAWLADSFYPDMRKALTEAKENSRSGALVVPASADFDEHEEWMDAVREYFAGGGLESARKKIVESVGGASWEAVYSWIYRNLDAVSDNEEHQKNAIRHLATGLDRLGSIADPELCLSGTLVAIAMDNAQ